MKKSDFVPVHVEIFIFDLLQHANKSTNKPIHPSTFHFFSTIQQINRVLETGRGSCGSHIIIIISNHHLTYGEFKSKDTAAAALVLADSLGLEELRPRLGAEASVGLLLPLVRRRSLNILRSVAQLPRLQKDKEEK